MNRSKKFASNLANEEYVIAALVLVWLTVLLLSLTSCTTVTPNAVHDNTPSFDGNTPTAGFLRFETNGCGIITTHARERYNALIEVYGRQFKPPLIKDYGVYPTIVSCEWQITKEALVHFMTMNRWDRQKKKLTY